MLISNIILRAFKKTIGILEKENIDWCLFGGLAIQVYKRIRATRDVDLLVGIDSIGVDKLITQMEEAGFKFDRKRGVIKLKGFELLRFIYIDEDTSFEIFIDFVTAQTEFQKQILTRKTKADFLGIEANVASLEDVILLKLLADRPIDFMDAQVLLEENKEGIDKNYLKDLAKKLDMQRKLQKLFKG